MFFFIGCVVVTDVQDTLLGCKLVTQRDTFITKEVMMNILMNIQVGAGQSHLQPVVWSSSGLEFDLHGSTGVCFAGCVPAV